MSDVKLSYEILEGSNILKVDGEVIFENSNRVKEKAKEIIKEIEAKKLIVDLSSTSYLDSSGIGVILSLFKFMRDNDGKLLIANPNEKVKRVFEVTKLNQILDIYNDINKAIEVS
ncbi:STAS domain-containing protein [Halanaerobiaceae bacterium Z-7014]|uniref:Anti-sigma factor antagonist n=1 Tax=Halonatronomonas betaini TaxID=2778430 RepID=A0A931F6V8_9FIRM|nr:STAS domain-containing protein [Halonatronomonas betaini]MBF8437335.1 STAS domain-containing protein [Halonatronomonas betaini]